MCKAWNNTLKTIFVCFATIVNNCYYKSFSNKKIVDISKFNNWNVHVDYTYVFGEHKYHFNDDNKKLTFKEAEKICENEGGTLPILARKMNRSAIRFVNEKIKCLKK